MSCPILYSKLLYKIGQDFLGRLYELQFETKLFISKVISLNLRTIYLQTIHDKNILKVNIKGFLTKRPIWFNLSIRKFFNGRGFFFSNFIFIAEAEWLSLHCWLIISGAQYKIRNFSSKDIRYTINITILGTEIFTNIKKKLIVQELPEEEIQAYYL